MGLLVSGGDVSSSITTRVYDADTGEQFWTANHGDTVRAVAADADGNIYTAGIRVSNITTRKYDKSGNLLWSADHGANAYSICVDSQGNVYTGGVRNSNVTTRKYDSDGTEITTGWPVDHGASVYALAVDTSDNLYTSGNVSSSQNTRKYDSSGSLQWSAFHSNSGCLHVAVRGAYIIHGGARNTLTPATSRVITASTGTLFLNKDHGVDSVYGAARAADSDGTPNNNFITGGNRTSSITTRNFPYNSATDNWTADHGGVVYGVCVSLDDGSVYTGGVTVSDTTTRKYQSDGTEITTDNWPLSHGTTTGISVRGVAWSAYTIAQGKPPGLAIPLGLGTPAGSVSVAAPALALALALGVPTATPRPAPPDVAGLSQIYRLFLTGGSSLLELPMSGLQCRRRLGESTWLTVDIPTYSAALAAAIAAVATRELVIYAGYVAGGVETSGEMMRATLTEIRNEREGGRGSIQLTGRVIPSTATVTSHTLTGVRQRGKDDSGRRTVTCAVDPRIRPNHTVNDGLHTFTAGSILYRISPAEAAMWIVENS